MDEIVRCAERGWDILLRAAVPLLVGGLVWTGLNLFTGGLLAGPALVGLFAIAIKTHQGRGADVTDVFAAFPDVAAPLIAGIAFILPFRLSAFLSTVAAVPSEIGSVPAVVPAAVPLVVHAFLAVWFAIGIHVFAVLADRPEEGLGSALKRAWRLAESGARSRATGLALHLALGLGAYLLIGLGLVMPGIGALTQVVTVPAAVCLLTAWYAHAALPSEPVASLDLDLEPEPDQIEESDPGLVEESTPAAKPRKKTLSRRPASSDSEAGGDSETDA